MRQMNDDERTFIMLIKHTSLEMGLSIGIDAIVAFQAGLLRASPPSPLSIKDGEGAEVLANERLRLLAAR